MKKLIAAITLTLLSTAQIASASAADDIGTDRFAHFGISYAINDQLQKSARMSPFAATLTTIAIGAAKEALIDDHFDHGDFAADCAGALFVNIHF